MENTAEKLEQEVQIDENHRTNKRTTDIFV